MTSQYWNSVERWIWLGIALLMVSKPIQSAEIDADQLQSQIQSAVQKVLPATVAVTQHNERNSITGSFSGVIVSADGLVLSAAHAVTPTNKYDIYLTDGTKLAAVGLGMNRELDCAMLQITDSGTWPYAEIGHSSSLKEDQPVVSISYPGLFNVKRGPVVRFGKIIRKVSPVFGMIHSTAMMEPGDSGGPLLDLDGKVVGIHSQIQQSLEQNFDVPIDSFRLHWDKLTQKAEFQVNEIPGLLPLGMKVRGGQFGGRGPRGGGPRGRGPQGGAPDSGTPGTGTPENGRGRSNPAPDTAPRDPAPKGDDSQGNTPSAEVPRGDAPSSSAPNGELPNGNAPSGASPSSETDPPNAIPKPIEMPTGELADDGTPIVPSNEGSPGRGGPPNGRQGGQGRGDPFGQGPNGGGRGRGGRGGGVIRISEVIPGGVAEKAGIQVGDEILQLDGRQIQQLNGRQISPFQRLRREIEVRGLQGEREFELLVRRDSVEKKVVLNFPDPSEEEQVTDPTVVTVSRVEVPTPVELGNLQAKFADLESRLDDTIIVVHSMRGKDEFIILATRLNRSGLLISKSSFVGDNPDVRHESGIRIPAEIIARDYENDLILLRASFETNVGVDLNDAAGGQLTDRVGTLLVTPDPDSKGYYSVLGAKPFVSNRNESRGFLGIAFPERSVEPVIQDIINGSSAQKAKLKSGDRIVAVDELQVSSPLQFITHVGKKDPGDVIHITIDRNGTEMSMAIELGIQQSQSGHVAELFQGGKSQRRDGFPQVVAHDGHVKPSDCGGPLFDTAGHFLGMNIARYSRTQTYAIPRPVIKSFVDSALAKAVLSDKK